MKKVVKHLAVSVTMLFTWLLAVALLGACGSSSNEKVSFQFKEGVQFSNSTVKQLVTKNEGKPIFLFAHAGYCSSCREMIKTVLPEKEVGDIFNSRFISAQVDIESEEGKELVKDFGITGTPTLLFLTPDGKLINKVSGFLSKDELIALAKSTKVNGKPVME